MWTSPRVWNLESRFGNSASASAPDPLSRQPPTPMMLLAFLSDPAQIFGNDRHACRHRPLLNHHVTTHRFHQLAHRLVLIQSRVDTTCFLLGFLPHASIPHLSFPIPYRPGDLDRADYNADIPSDTAGNRPCPNRWGVRGLTVGERRLPSSTILGLGRDHPVWKLAKTRYQVPCYDLRWVLYPDLNSSRLPCHHLPL
ncbi:hypothetical protein VTK56DRAFT_3440 [Thermocarpiscus australiensis]